MAGKPGRSGPPLNLNNARHPWRSFWRRRALKPTHRWVLPVIEEYAGTLLREKADPTQGELRTIEVAQIARGCSMLILAECASAGLIQQTAEGWDLSPGAKELGKFLNIELKALSMLGLERRAKQVPSLADYLSARAGAANGASGDNPTEQDEAVEP